MPPLECGSVAYRPLREPKATTRERPLVSVVTVAFNAEKTIAAAIRSVADQTYEGPIEYIIIDGGSTDATLGIAGALGEHVDCLLSEPDDGVYDALNKGFLRARGAYVALLNSDDRLFPEFVVDSVDTLERTGADISFCDYESEEGLVVVDTPNDGFFLSQLAIKHNTFLLRRHCFARVGGFDPYFRIVADAKWNRAAYASDLTFVKTKGAHVFYSSRGLSAAATPELREKIISESVALLRKSFPELDKNQARALYLANFNTDGASDIAALYDRYRDMSPLLGRAIKQALRWNLAYRSGYRLLAANAGRIKQLKTLTDSFDVAFEDLRVADQESPRAQQIGRFLKELGRIAAAAEERGASVHLHFARKFSSPSETFIHNFLTDLCAQAEGVLHVMLCDERQEEDSRSYPYVLTLPWDELDQTIREVLYGVVWDRLAPARIVAHFALNGWWLHNRLSREQRDRPWVNMCHGIDVFSIEEQADYKAFIRDYCALTPKVVFTAVSDFLCARLAKAGVPERKIFKVPNAVSHQFREMRKTSGFWSGGRPLRVLSVGRLIGWKGHDILLRAVAMVRARHPETALHVEIVYGQFDENLSRMEGLAAELGLAEMIRFVPSVNFRTETGYFPGFDLFVLPSTESDDPEPRTETFGIAILEAIVAGLPVIGTNAGGIPEIVGPQNPQAVIVPHGQAEPLADAISEMISRANVVFRKIGPHADDRAATFSAQRRLREFAKLDEWFLRKRPRVLNFCALAKGGAACASINVHKALLKRGYNSVFVTRDIETDRLPRYLPNTILLSANSAIDYNHLEAPKRPGFTTFTLDNTVISNLKLALLVEGADLVNLTWAAKFLSVRNISMLTHMGIPIAITLRDMQSITGGCHFFHGCKAWQDDCANCPQLPLSQNTMYSKLTLDAKKASWNLSAVTFIALSDQSMEILSRSSLGQEVNRIKQENYVDTTVFFPDPTPLELQLPPSSSDTVRIGYLPSFDSRIKGHDEFCAALRTLHSMAPEAKIQVLMCGGIPIEREEIRFEIASLDVIEDCGTLRRFYNTCDIVAVPSLEETFSNTTLEALACGTPVVGFKTGILAELLREGDGGRVVEVGDTDALAKAILDLSSALPSREALALRIASRFGEDARMDAYDATFRDLISRKPQVREPTGGAELASLEVEQERIRTTFAIRRLRRERHERLKFERAYEELVRKNSRKSTAPYRHLRRTAKKTYRFARQAAIKIFTAGRSKRSL